MTKGKVLQYAHCIFSGRNILLFPLSSMPVLAWLAQIYDLPIYLYMPKRHFKL